MNSASIGAFRCWGTILGSFLLFFGIFSFVHAQEEAELIPPPEVEEVFLGEMLENDGEVMEEDGEAVVLEEKPEPPNPEKARYDSESTVSVKQVKDISVQLAVFGFLLLMLLICIAFIVRDRNSEYGKKLTFWSMVFVIVVPTLFFLVSTIFVNVISDTKGPVHWHADFRIYHCGVEYEPPEPPHRLSNKTGTPEVHQHEDKRLHIEGVLVDVQEGSLANFFGVQGGKLTENAFLVPHKGGHTWHRNGDECPNGEEGEWNVFLYKTDSETMEVTKEKMDMVDVPDYVLSPYINVPPGDCIIFAFGPEIDDTDYICNFYQVNINKGEIFPTWTP